MNNSFDVNFYKKQLSPFGQKVLRVLVEQWHTEKSNFNNTFRKSHCIAQPNRTVRYSRNSTKSSDTFDSFELNVGQYSRKKCTLKFLERETPIASTPLELLNYKTITEKNEKTVMCTDDLINSAIELNADTNGGVLSEKLKLLDTVEDESIPLIDLGSPHISPSNINNVSWNNMYDTELFQDKNNNPSIEDTMITLENRLDHNISEIPMDTFKKPETNLLKRKHTTELTEPKPKKERKLTVPNTKNIPRKKNYTKAVTNWLNDVKQNFNTDSENKANIPSNIKVLPVKKVETKIKISKEQEPNKKDFVIDSENNENFSSKVKAPVKEVDTKIRILKQQKPKKKVIQAQLANKEGKMKFGKPKNVEDTKDKEKNIVDAKNTEVKDTNPVPAEAQPDQDKTKEKKSKSKFIAPIKSQIPERDVTYDIITVNADNVAIYESTLVGILSSDVFVVLVYRNGFCQLNCSYTEDSCVPEGIIVNTNETFFYFKAFDNIRIRTILSKVLEANTVICFEGKNILIFLSHYGININPSSICDTKVGGALLHPDNPPESFSDLQKLVSHSAEYTIATDCVLQKAAWYITLLRETTARLRVLMVDNSLWSVFVDIEMRLLPIIAEMERRGVSVDLEKLKSMELILVTKLKTVEQECHKAAGKQFQVNSPLQVRALLFDELKLDTKCNVKIRETLTKGAKSTSEATLRSLMSVHPLPKLILEYRHLHKAHATFLTGIAQHVKDGIVRPTWVQTAAATGRIASNNPNLQAIPKAPFSLIMFPESEDIENPVLNFRSVYTAGPGQCLLAADFKHVECRVFAHAAGDATLLEALQSDQDLFRVLAAKWLNKSLSEVSDADRERTKRIVYASLYGAGARKLMDILDASYEQTLAITASFNRTFPSLKSFGRDVVARCGRGGGRLRSLCGRARTFKHISSQDFAARAHAERQAVNFIVQGSAADLCKMAMILTEERLRVSSPAVRARLVLQIHDELVWEVHEDDLHRAAEAVRVAMEGCGRGCGLPLRLPVALAAGKDWGSLRPLTTSTNNQEALHTHQQ